MRIHGGVDGKFKKTCSVKTCVIGHGKVLIGHGNRVKNVNCFFGIFMHENCENAKMRKCEKHENIWCECLPLVLECA